MNPLRAVDGFAALLERAGLAIERGEFEGSPTLAGASGDHELLLDLFCELARTPVDRKLNRGGQKWIVPDDQDADLLLHESGLETASAHREQVFYAVTFGRQFSFEDRRGDYVGMSIFHLSLETDGVPEGRVPTAQRWGYGGPPRAGESDAQHSEIANWAGHVDAWAAAVRRSNSWREFDVLPMVRFSASQGDV